MLINDIRKKGKLHFVRVSDMEKFFKSIKGCNPKQEIYRVIALEKKELSYAITIIKPGRINREFFMTKGHYHTLPSSEIYYILKGRGIILIEKGSSSKAIKIRAGEFYEAPEGYAHRTINTGSSPLEFLSVYSSKSGHDYKRIEKKGFKKRFY